MSSKKPAPKKPKTKKITHIDLKKAAPPIAEYARSLAVVLTTAEKDDRQKEAGKLSLHIDEVTAKKRAENEKHGAELKKSNARLKQLLGTMATGTEDREIKVAEIPDADARLIFVVRRDSGVVLDTRKMSAEERGGEAADGKTGDQAGEKEQPATGKRRKLSRAAAKKADEAKKEGDDKTDDGDKPDDAPDAE